MTSGRATLTAFLILIGGLVLAIAAVAADWPLIAWSIAFGLISVGALVLVRALSGPPPLIPLEATLAPDLPIPPVERQEALVTDVPLPSATADYDFLFSAVVRWVPVEASPGARHANPGGLAVDSVLERAREITAQQAPGQAELVRHRLNGVLGEMAPDRSGQVRAMAADVSLRLSDDDRERLTKLAAVRKNEEVWEHERNYERNKRHYLADDVLKDTGSAVVWWLSRNDNQVEGAVQRIDVLARLTGAANNRELPPLPGSPEPGWPEDVMDSPAAKEDALDELMRWLGVAEDDPVRALLADRLARAVGACGFDEAAGEILRRFDRQGPQEEENDDPYDVDPPF